LLGLYLLGKIKFAHDSEVAHLGLFRFFMVLVVFTFVIYLITGLFGAPLKGITSLLPSQETSWFSSKAEPAAVNTPDLAFRPFDKVAASPECAEPKYGDKFRLPYGLKGYFDYKQGLECARKLDKPAFIDFKGHACANCKLMEARVWSDPEVLKRLRDNFVIIALYLDDRTQVPESEWIISSVDGKTKKTIGKINEDLEISKFKTNAMPLYVIADHEGNPLNEPMPTNLNIEEYKKWLDEGVRLFNNRTLN
jgi:thiol:disulfide interchange protein DsbD